MFQKSPDPNLDDLPGPLFESELKKAQIKVTTKVPTTPHQVEGTSVMPRQRPKGASATPFNLNNIPLGISSSPTSIKRSQSPVAQVPAPVPVPQNPSFTPSFPPNNNPSYLSVSDYQGNTTNFFQNSDMPPPQLESLFQSSVYPDPFRDEMASCSPTAITDVSNESKRDVVPSIPLNLSPVSPDNPLFGSGNINQGRTPHVKSGLTESTNFVASNTPPSSPSLSVPKGHRRNMSETTAFSK